MGADAEGEGGNSPEPLTAIEPAVFKMATNALALLLNHSLFTEILEQHGSRPSGLSHMQAAGHPSLLPAVELRAHNLVRLLGLFCAALSELLGTVYLVRSGEWRHFKLARWLPRVVEMQASQKCTASKLKI